MDSNSERKQHHAKQKEEDDCLLSEDDLRLYHEVWLKHTLDLVNDGSNS